MQNNREIWKPISGYEGIYEISSCGRIRSLTRTVRKWDGYKTVVGREIKQATNLKGYQFVELCKLGCHQMKTVHRLVAEAFIPNPTNLPQINHKDEDKTNNRVENLEWCSCLYNNRYGDRIRKAKQTMSKRIVVMDKDGSIVMDFSGIPEAASHFNVAKSTIWNYVHKGRGLGYLFKYK